MSQRVDLLRGNIPLSIAKLSLPLMGMSFLQMTYNLVDMFWIGKLGADAVAAVGTGGQLVWLCMGIHTISQLGGQVYVAQNLGMGDTQTAARYAHASILLTTLISIILGLIATLLVGPVVGVFNLNSTEVIAATHTYVMVCCGLIFFQLMAKLLTALITVTGDSKTPFKATLVGLLINLVLDPLLIFGLGPIPGLGILGAGIATVTAQLLVFAMLLLHIKNDTHLFCYIQPTKLPALSYFKSIIKLGFPTTVQATLFPLFSIYVSRLVANFGDNAVAVQRVGSQLESISWMMTDGFSLAVNSFIGQNYGAGNLQRAKRGFYQSLAMLSVYGLLSTLLLTIFPSQLFSIFLSEPEVLAMGVDYMIILGLSQLFLCVELLSISAMNGCGKTLLPATIASALTFLRIPLAIFLSATALGLCGIWWAVSITTIAKGILLLLGTMLCFHKLTQPKSSDSPLS